VEEDRRLVETAEVVQDSPHKINYRKEYFPPNARFDKFTKLSQKGHHSSSSFTKKRQTNESLKKNGRKQIFPIKAEPK
jgi:hypothetical protein